VKVLVTELRLSAFWGCSSMILIRSSMKVARSGFVAYLCIIN